MKSGELSSALKDWQMYSARGNPSSPSGYELTDAPFYCVLTRIQIRHVWALPMMFHLYLDVRRDARRIRQLKRCAFLFEDLRTFVILSVWEGEAAFLEFGTAVAPHLIAARKALSHAGAAIARPKAPAVWSTEWRIRAASHNLNWGPAEDWDGLWLDAAKSPSDPAPMRHETVRSEE